MADLLLGFIQQLGFQLLQPTFRRTHQLQRGRGGFTHELQYFLNRDPAVHDPDPPGFAVLRLNSGQEILEGRLIRRIAGQHLVRQ